MQEKLKSYSIGELRKLAEKMDLVTDLPKKKLIEEIKIALDKYEEYKKEKLDKYLREQQLGKKGKEGTTFLVTNTENKKQYAMKTFRKTKSSNRLMKEYELQKKAAKIGVAPKVYDYDIVSKYIVMERMDRHLFEQLLDGDVKGENSESISRDNKENKYNFPDFTLSKKQQERILEIFNKLDKAGVYHNDANLTNYMIKNNKIYLIDYGLSKEITKKLCKSLNTDRPNYTFMSIGFVLKLKKFNVNKNCYKYVLAAIPKPIRKIYDL